MTRGEQDGRKEPKWLFPILRPFSLFVPSLVFRQCSFSDSYAFPPIVVIISQRVRAVCFLRGRGVCFGRRAVEFRVQQRYELVFRPAEYES